MSFSDPGFEEMSFEELREWLADNDLSSADYSDLLQQLVVDLPTALPGVVQSSIGGSTTTAPAQGSTLVWDAAQQLYVPSSMSAVLAAAGIARGVVTLTFSASTNSGNVTVTHGLSGTPTVVVATSLFAPAFGEIPICNPFSFGATTFSINGQTTSSWTGTVTASWVAIL